MSMRITIELPEYSDYLFCLADAKDFAGYGGVYIMYGYDARILYIGKTRDFYQRMQKHYSKASNSAVFMDEVKYIQIYEFEHGADRDIFETYLINKLQPVYNERKMYFNESDDASLRRRFKKAVPELNKGRWKRKSKGLPPAVLAAYNSVFKLAGKVDEGFEDIEEEALHRYSDVVDSLFLNKR